MLDKTAQTAQDDGQGGTLQPRRLGIRIVLAHSRDASDLLGQIFEVAAVPLHVHSLASEPGQPVLVKITAVPGLIEVGSKMGQRTEGRGHDPGCPRL